MPQNENRWLLQLSFHLQFFAYLFFFKHLNTQNLAPMWIMRVLKKFEHLYLIDRVDVSFWPILKSENWLPEGCIYVCVHSTTQKRSPLL